MPSRAVGIDLGTSHVALARFDEMGRSAIVRDAQGDVFVPNVVFFEDDELLFGRAAKQAAAGEPGRAGESSTRDLGRDAYSRAIGGELLKAELIEACLLKHLMTPFTTSGAPKPAVVLSVPACFNHAQRRAVFEAGQIAGLDVLGTLTGTLAATLTFAESQGYLDALSDKPRSRLLVFDLGGGKLDAAVVEVKPGRVRTMAVGGDTRLGGREWDAKLADHLAGEFVKQFGEDPRYDMKSVRRLLESAEEAKHSLTVRQQARVHLERSANAADITISRQTFEDITEDLLERAQRVVEGVLTRAGLVARDLNATLLVGGATRMPAVDKMLQTLTGLKPVPNIHPEEAVARGAAIYAETLLAARDGRRSKIHLEITDMTPRSLGVEWVDPASGRVENVVIIQRGTELPCAAVSRLTTTADGQTSISVQLLEGESRDADECSRIAEVVLRDLPVGLPKGWPVEVQYRYDAAGRLEVKAQIEKTGRALTAQVRHQGVLSAGETADWRKLLAGRVGLTVILEMLRRHQKLRAESEPGPTSGAVTADAARAPAMPVAGATGAASAAGGAVGLPVGVAAAAGRMPPQLPTDQASGQGELGFSPGYLEDLDLELGDRSAVNRAKKYKLTPRNVAIMLIGYVISAALGLAIGYYILMRIDPSYNWFHLRLPGLSAPPPAGAVR